ncbi:hypothetical protein MBLNU459_g5956t2 [Dothideomycetes sp. NU459]
MVIVTVHAESTLNIAVSTTVTPRTSITAVSTITDYDTDTAAQTIDVMTTLPYVPTSTSVLIQTGYTTSTSIVLKSDVLKTMVSIVSSESLQPFCSTYLGYTTSTASTYMTISTTATVVTTNLASTETHMVTQTVTASTASIMDKRQAPNPYPATPSALGSYSNDFISSACALAVQSPSAKTESLTTTYTTTATSVVSITSVTLTSTATSTPVVKNLLADPSFELNDDAWACGSECSLAYAPEAAYAGNYMAQLTAEEGIYGEVYQTITANSTASYLLSFEYMSSYPWVSGCTVTVTTSFAATQILENDSNLNNIWYKNTTTLIPDPAMLPGSQESIQITFAAVCPSDEYFVVNVDEVQLIAKS